MKRNRRKRVFSIICYIINIIIVFYPWIIVGNTKYNIVQLKRKIETIGIHTMIKRGSGCSLLLLYPFVSWIYCVCSNRKKLETEFSDILRINWAYDC